MLVVLEDVFTTAERTLVRAGRGEHVRAFLSQTSIDPEMAIELFVLEPLDGQ